MSRPRPSGLGRGLSALMEEVSSTIGTGSTTAAPVSLPVARVVAHAGQPRRRFDNQAMTDLTASIRERGVLQPILVRPLPGNLFEIVAGERRWRAAQAAGLHEIPVVVRELDDIQAYEVALIENIQRADLNPIEEAEGYARLIHDFGHTQDAVAKVVGKARSHIANLLRLLDLPEGVRAMVIDGRLGMGHARALAATADPVGLASRAVSEGMSVRQVEAAARKQGDAPVAPDSTRHRTSSRDPNLMALEGQLAEAIGSSVTITVGEVPGTGVVSMNFASLDQLDLICQRLSGTGRF
jgi:ParB family chromosome partitioning protein